MQAKNPRTPESDGSLKATNIAAYADSSACMTAHSSGMVLAKADWKNNHRISPMNIRSTHVPTFPLFQGFSTMAAITNLLARLHGSVFSLRFPARAKINCRPRLAATPASSNNNRGNCVRLTLLLAILQSETLQALTPSAYPRILSTSWRLPDLRLRWLR